MKIRKHFDMRKINEKDYVNFTIVGSGWSFTVHTWEKAKSEWANMKFGTLYRNKADGTRAIIDNK